MRTVKRWNVEREVTRGVFFRPRIIQAQITMWTRIETAKEEEPRRTGGGGANKAMVWEYLMLTLGDLSGAICNLPSEDPAQRGGQNSWR